MIIRELEIEDYLEKKLIELEKKGSDRKELLKLRKEAYLALKKEELATDALTDATAKFLSARNKYNVPVITGLSTNISLNSNVSINLMGGKNNNGSEINEETLFDIASVTKLYTLVLVFKLVELCYFNLDDVIARLDNRFKLGHFTVLDLLLMHGEIQTNGLIKNAKNQKEALIMLKSATLKNHSREKNTYTDMGAIILSKVIEKVVNEKFNKNFTYDQIMKHFIFDRYDLLNTTFKPSNLNVAGNGSKDAVPHDPKAKVLGSIGSAGIFTTSNDLSLFAERLFDTNLISKENLMKCGTSIFENSNKGYMGLYLKQPGNLDKTYVPGLFSKSSFAHQGWTGAMAAFDPTNHLHNSILVNAIPLEKVETNNDKVVGYNDEFVTYQNEVAKTSMVLKILKDYYTEKSDEFVLKKTIKL